MTSHSPIHSGHLGRRGANFTLLHARQQRHLPRQTLSFANARNLDLRNEMFTRAILGERAREGFRERVIYSDLRSHPAMMPGQQSHDRLAVCLAGM
jgi:hypothetical protein